jgi:hypothetical protein
MSIRKNNTSRVGSGTVKEVTEDQVDVYLTHEEMSKMSEFVYEQTIATLKAEKNVLKEEKLVLQMQKMQVDLELMKVKSASLVNDIKEIKQKSLDYITTLKQKYQITAEKFGYMPDTGKLVLEDLN